MPRQTDQPTGSDFRFHRRICPPNAPQLFEMIGLNAGLLTCHAPQTVLVNDKSTSQGPEENTSCSLCAGDCSSPKPARRGRMHEVE